MATTLVVTCDGCSEGLDDSAVGRKVVIGCENQFPPSTFFNYHPCCEVPPIAELAKMMPHVLFQEICMATATGGWIPIWSGELMFCPETEIFMDSSGKVIAESDIPPITQ